MADQNIYIDSAAAPGGDGTIGTPYNTLSDINWTTVQGWVTGGDTVYVNLAKGSTFNETMTVGASGASGRPVTVQAYGSGDDPIIDGENSRNYCISTGSQAYLSFVDLDLRNTILECIVSGSSVTASKCLFTLNSADGSKGISLTSGTVSYCVFDCRLADVGLLRRAISATGAVTVDNCTLIGADSGSVYAGATSTITLRNCICYDLASVTKAVGGAINATNCNFYSTSTANLDTNTGEISGDPLFTGAEDWSLTDASPCVATGVTGLGYTVDYGGSPIPDDDVNVGAYQHISDIGSDTTSTKDIFESNLFGGWIFAAGVFRGTGVDVVEPTWTDPTCSITTNVTMASNLISTGITMASNSISTNVTMSTNSITEEIGIGCGNQ